MLIASLAEALQALPRAAVRQVPALPAATGQISQGACRYAGQLFKLLRDSSS